MFWFKFKTSCEVCETEKTKRKFEDKATCNSCLMNILCSREEKRICPVDGTTMKKQFSRDQVIIDTCPTCKGIWLDQNELEALREKSKNEGYDSGFWSGVIIG